MARYKLLLADAQGNVLDQWDIEGNVDKAVKDDDPFIYGPDEFGPSMNTAVALHEATHRDRLAELHEAGHCHDSSECPLCKKEE